MSDQAAGSYNFNTSTYEQFDRIGTVWSEVWEAHQGTDSEVIAARNFLVMRYHQAIRSYLGAILKNDDEADELAQEVVVRLLKGEFRSANPEKGRFRDFLKVAVKNMARTYWGQKKRRATAALDPAELPDELVDDHAADPLWNEDWGKNVLDTAWTALQEHERLNPGNVFYTLLRLRVDAPDDDSETLARRMTEKTGRSMNAAATRQQLRRARLRLAHILVEEIRRGLDKPTPDLMEQELIDVGLMEYVRDFLPPDWKMRGELEPDLKGISDVESRISDLTGIGELSTLDPCACLRPALILLARMGVFLRA